MLSHQHQHRGRHRHAELQPGHHRQPPTATAVLVIGTDATQQVDKVRVTLDSGSATCFLPISFENISTPFSQGALNAVGYLPTDSDGTRTSGRKLSPAPEFDQPFPKVLLNVYAHSNGNACTPNSGGNAPSGVVSLDASAPNPTAYSLANNCDWTVEFLPSFADFKLEGLNTADLQCTASVRIKDRNGQALGNPIAGAPVTGDLPELGGGSFTLETSSTGLTYAGSLVGSIEFLGCLEVEYHNSSLVQIFDDAAPLGDLSYTISAAEDRAGATTCDGFEPPASQTQADGLVFADAPGVHSHYLNHSCDWVVTFTSTNECEALAVWNYTQDYDSSTNTDNSSLAYLDSVLADPASPGTLSVRLLQHHDPDHENGQSGFVYYLGSGTSTPGGLRYASDGAGAGGAAGPAPEADSPGGLPSAPGLYTGPGQPADANAPADPAAMAAVNALSLECVSDIAFESISGLEGPPMEIKATPTVTDSTSAAAATCHTSQSRLPDASTIRAAESFSLALNVKCSWNLEFKTTSATCRTRLHAKVFDNAATPASIATISGQQLVYDHRAHRQRQRPAIYALGRRCHHRRRHQVLQLLCPNGVGGCARHVCGRPDHGFAHAGRQRHELRGYQ